MGCIHSTLMKTILQESTANGNRLWVIVAASSFWDAPEGLPDTSSNPGCPLGDTSQTRSNVITVGFKQNLADSYEGRLPPE